MLRTSVPACPFCRLFGGGKGENELVVDGQRLRSNQQSLYRRETVQPPFSIHIAYGFCVCVLCAVRCLGSGKNCVYLFFPAQCSVHTPNVRASSWCQSLVREKFKRGSCDSSRSDRRTDECAHRARETFARVCANVINTLHLFCTFTGTFNSVLYWFGLRSMGSRTHTQKCALSPTKNAPANFVFFSILLCLFSGRSKYDQKT